MKTLSLIILCLFLSPAAHAAGTFSLQGRQSPELAVPVYFAGQIDAVGPLRWVVAGEPLVVDNRTKIEGELTPAAGMNASVMAYWLPGETLRAGRIEVRQYPFPLPGGPRFIAGIVSAIAPDHWVVAGEPVAISRGTRIVGAPVVGAFALARIGDFLETPVARLIVVAPAGQLPQMLRGEIRSVTQQGWMVHISGSDWLIDIVDTTVVEGQPQAGRQADLMVLQRPDASLEALYAAVGDAAVGVDVVTGRLLAKIDGTQPAQWLLLEDGDGPAPRSTTILVDRQTTLIDERYGPAGEGAWLEVLGTPELLPFSAWSAQRVLVDGGPLTAVEGAIARVEGAPSSGLLRLAGEDVIFSDATLVDGRLLAGRYAMVRGSRQAATLVWAAQIEVRYRFNGQVVERFSRGSVETWVIAVENGGQGIDTTAQARVYLLVDQSTRVDPTLINATAGVPVAVQARAAESGWVGDWIEDLRR